MTSSDQPQDVTMTTLFRQELSTYLASLERWLAEVHKTPGLAEAIDSMANAARSIRGAAKLLQVRPVAELAGDMEDLLRDLITARHELTPEQIQALSGAVEALRQVLSADDLHLTLPEKWGSERLQRVIDAHIALKRGHATGQPGPVPLMPPPTDKEAEAPPSSKISGRRLPTPLKKDEPATDQQLMGLFFIELEAQTGILTDSLLALEANPHDSEATQALMRAAHSIKGAARVLGLDDIIHVAHSLEDAFQKIQRREFAVDTRLIDLLFSAVDILGTLSKAGPSDLPVAISEQKSAMQLIVQQLECFGQVPATLTLTPKAATSSEATISETAIPRLAHSDIGDSIIGVPTPPPKVPSATSFPKRLNEARQASRLARKDRVVRVTADYLTRLMGLAGELLVESRWLQPFSDALLHLKKNQYELSAIVDILRASINEKILGEEGEQHLLELQHKTHSCRETLAKHLEDLELFIRRHTTLSDRLYRQIITSRMCPFGEGVEAFPRMIRDLAKQLGKRVTLEIVGRSTSIDRDILDKLKAPLNHLLRNAVDHGIEMPEERIAKGKPPEGHIRLEARHRAGVLSITVSDDGRGIDLNQVRNRVLQMKLVDVDMAQNLTESELLDFLFLPGFTTSSTVTEISGRGVGLNVVQNMVHEVSGQVRVGGKKDQGAIFSLQLPLTLSVLRALLVEISNEPYAFPLARVERAMVIDRSRIKMVEGREYYNFDGLNIGLIPGHLILELPEHRHGGNELSIVVLSDGFNAYGIVVDRLLGEKELVVQELDGRLGKVSDISCGAFMEDGSPILVIDIEDTVRSIDKLLSTGSFAHLSAAELEAPLAKRKKVLVVDDSITVREVECRILENHGYDVDVAVNGVDGWNTVRIGDYDLVVTDVDMPRMNGIELVKAIKNDPRLHKLPVMIVSYKERSDDRMLGMEAGANYYLAKSSFHDDRFLEAVRDLIGEPVQP